MEEPDNKDRIAVTGAYSYSGRYITRVLLDQGRQVITLTGHPNRPHPFGDQVQAFPYSFDQPQALVASLRGTSVLYNTYWVRFNLGDVSFQQAIANTRLLIQAAKDAGVRRLVHISVTNPPPDSSFPYFQGKYILEQAVQDCGLSFAIIRPTLVYAPEDILVNNIAYLLRRLPVFAIPGEGSYRLQPIFAGDLAEIAVQAGQMNENLVWDAAGPEIFTYEQFVGLIAVALGRKVGFVHLPPGMAYAASRILSAALKDVLITRHEIDGLMDEMLVSAEPPRGHTLFGDWLENNASWLGQRYASELERHFG
jgi:NADH dehydrogenase